MKQPPEPDMRPEDWVVVALTIATIMSTVYLVLYVVRSKSLA
jgi:hypothetical protein